MISYVAYLGQMLWPSGLAVLYPFKLESINGTSIAVSVIVLAGLSMGFFALRRRCPYLLIGWLWYLIMLAPVIGIVQVGGQARADRYTYLPQIGLYLLLTWAMADVCAGWRHRRVMLGGLSAVILGVLVGCARAQVAYWQNSETLWTHTLACTSDNVGAHVNLGNALLKKGELDQAITQFQSALQINPYFARTYYNLGNAFRKEGRLDAAIAYYQKALQLEPDYTEACYNLGNAFLQTGRTVEAISYYQKTVLINPDYVEGLNNLAWVLATSPQASLRNGNQAVGLAQRANQLTGNGNPIVLATLAAAYAETGQFSNAAETARRALQLPQARSNPALADAIQSQLKLYQTGRPFHLQTN
jgi:tetratricopeptide (TPR) repeat protein